MRNASLEHYLCRFSIANVTEGRRPSNLRVSYSGTILTVGIAKLVCIVVTGQPVVMQDQLLRLRFRMRVASQVGS